MQDKTSILIPDGIYHIYNKVNAAEKLFLSHENYRFFLLKFGKHLNSILFTLSYCLMPNHFRFLVRIKSEHDLKLFFRDKIEKKVAKGPNLTGFQNLSGLMPVLISKQFSNFFNAYSKAFNKQNNRKGNLFNRPFKRKQVKDEAYLRKLVHYIHYNPIKAGIRNNYDWKFSSYQAIVSNQKTNISRNEVIEYFDDIANFK